ncbi:acyltransferase family protein [Mycolicibacterium sp. 120270]|uniref:acyltransferase family protein n=1 Tax=Mycolicibacterium sp. 120270 TaxID=3090600 RepID=UPI00299D0146|nr:acyltransferase family protein [Mycolicibacterium sp. 120270]MDX1883546.1 acyltransferase family protein [Mycolicibacterium sp. 120270]
MNAAVRRRGDLDGLRGLAIALVVIYHVWFGRVSGGVDVFLVLSGFFFGGRLLGQASGPGPVEPLTTALGRLVRRLLPAIVVVLAACTALTVWIQPQTRWETFAGQSLATLGYYQNWHLAAAADDYQRAGQSVSPLQHMWSMSVQGQFFVALLIIATLVALGARAAGRSSHRRAALVTVVGLATVASFVYAVVAHDLDQPRAYYDSFARAWEPLAGVLAAAVCSTVRMPAAGRIVAAAGGLLAILGCGIVIDGAAEFPGALAVVPVVGTLLVVLGGGGSAPERLWPYRLLASAPLSLLGSIAYALYLWHWPLLIFWLAYTDRDSAGLADGALVVAASAVLAYLTFRFVEEPLRQGGSDARTSQPSRGYAAALAGATVVLAVAVAVMSLGWNDHVKTVRATGNELRALPVRDYPGGRALMNGVRVAKLPTRPTALEADVDYPATTFDGCITDFRSTDIVRCEYGDRSASRVIALAGGSHSEHWITALDALGREHGFRVITFLKMGCPLTTDEEFRVLGSNAVYPECPVWVRRTMDALSAERPDYVFITTTRPFADGPGDTVPEGYLGIWDELQANGIGMLGMRDTPWMYKSGSLFSPVECLADGGDADTCGLPRREALDDRNPTLDYADRYPLMSMLDLSDSVCGADVCRAVEGNVLVYHDSNHLSTMYVRTLADALSGQLSAATKWW